MEKINEHGTSSAARASSKIALILLGMSVLKMDIDVVSLSGRCESRGLSMGFLLVWVSIDGACSFRWRVQSVEKVLDGSSLQEMGIERRTVLCEIFGSAKGIGYLMEIGLAGKLLTVSANVFLNECTNGTVRNGSPEGRASLIQIPFFFEVCLGIISPMRKVWSRANYYPRSETSLGRRVPLLTASFLQVRPSA